MEITGENICDKETGTDIDASKVIEKFKKRMLKKQSMRYEDFLRKNVKVGDEVYFCLPRFGSVYSHVVENEKIYLIKNLSITREQGCKVLSYNKLLNVSIWLNDGWEPNWANPKEKKWFICYDTKTNNYSIHYTTNKKSCNVYFKSKRLCKTAIEIMGDYYMSNIFDENNK